MGLDTTNYFNFEIIFYELIGSVFLTFIVGCLVIFFLSIRHDIPFKPMSIIISIWGIVMFSVGKTTLLPVYALILLAAGAIWYFVVNRKLQRG